MIAALNEWGATAILLSDFSSDNMAYQLAVATHSDVVIGLHGAGLINIILAPTNSVLIELKTPYGYSSDLFALAADARWFLITLNR